MSNSNFFDDNDVVTGAAPAAQSDFFHADDIVQDEPVAKSAPLKEDRPGIVSKVASSLKETVGKAWDDKNPFLLAPGFLAAGVGKRLYDKVDARDGDINAYSTGAQPGLSMGTSDEVAGGLGALADKYVPEDIKTYLSGRNDKLDYAPQKKSLKDLYTEYRDKERNRLHEAEQQNPEAFMIGDIAGGAALPFGKVMQGMQKLTGASKTLQAVEAAKAANILQKTKESSEALKLAKVANSNPNLLSNVLGNIAIGGTEGMGRSEGETASEVIDDAGNSAVLAGAIPYAGEAFKQFGSKVGVPLLRKFTPKQLLAGMDEANTLGKQGINVATDEFAEKGFQKAKSAGSEAGKVLTDRTKELKRGRMADESKFVDGVNAEKLDLNKSSLALEKQTKEMLELQKLHADANNVKVKAQIEAKINDKAKDIQDKVLTVRKEVGDNYTKIYQDAESVGVKVNADAVIDTYITKLQNMGDAEMSTQGKENVITALNKYRGDIDFKDFRKLKDTIAANLSKGKPTLSGSIANESYMELNNLLSNTLETTGNTELNQALKTANHKWKVISDIDRHVDGFIPTDALKRNIGNPQTINTIRNSANTDAGYLAKDEDFSGLARVLLPEEELGSIKSLSKEFFDAENYKTPNPNLKDTLALTPEYQELLAKKELLKAKKYQAPDMTTEEEKLAVLGNTGISRRNKVMGLNSKAGAGRTGADAKEATLDDLHDILTQQKGQEYKDDYVKRVADTNLHRYVSKATNNSESNRDLYTKTGIMENVGNAITGGVVNVANKAGMMSVQPNSLTNKFQKFSSMRPKASISTVAAMVDSNPEVIEKRKLAPETITQHAQKAAQDPSREGQEVAQTLEKASQENNTTKRAVDLFKLQQQNAKYRQMLRDNDGKKEDKALEVNPYETEEYEN